jgi:hypothetical protein
VTTREEMLFTNIPATMGENHPEPMKSRGWYFNGGSYFIDYSNKLHYTGTLDAFIQVNSF